METETIAGKTVIRTFNQFEDFNVGDVVRLKSGGPNMTVDNASSSRITCVWFEPCVLPDGTVSPVAANIFYRQEFDQGALEKVTPTSDEAVPQP